MCIYVIYIYLYIYIYIKKILSLIQSLSTIHPNIGHAILFLGSNVQEFPVPQNGFISIYIFPNCLLIKLYCRYDKYAFLYN